MMAQYHRAKSAHPGAVLLFRMGDFYETFYDDAKLLARETGVALTSRNPADKDPIPLAGFPWHGAEPYIAKLLRAGHRVAVCEQVEESAPGRKLLERKVVEVLTPGTALGDSLLSSDENNFVVALRPDGVRVGLAVLDISTGEFRVGDLSREDAALELERCAPSEVVFAEADREWAEALATQAGLSARVFRTSLDAWRFARERSERLLLEHFRVVSLEPFECDDLGPGVAAAGALYEYAREQKQSAFGHLRPPARIRVESHLALDEATFRSLEILESMPGAPRGATLLGVLDHTVTAAGGRRLRAALRRPLVDLSAIEGRQSAVEALRHDAFRAPLRSLLASTGDAERILARLHCDRATPRDLGALRTTFAAAPELTRLVLRHAGESALPTPDLASITPLHQLLHMALVDQPPTSLAEGGVFRDDWDPELNELLSLARDAKGWIARLQEDERARTGIATLKVGFNRVFGYYLEVSQSQASKVPPHYQRKQTIAGGERYLTPELKAFEQRLLSAEENQQRRERALFADLCTRLREATSAMQELARTLGELDFLQTLAESAARHGWVRPRLTSGDSIEIVAGRHPVVEAAVGRDRFVPNDTRLDRSEDQLVVLTGPNMAGKSTYLRQVGLLVVLAQLGSSLPAESAEIGLVDRIFTRVGAQDALARGQSTFLVEMIETSRILRHATARSLVLLDEVGRGTSTYDGLAIAWAVTEALADPAGARPRTIFATHFHELAGLATPGGGIRNRNVLVKEWGDEVVFLHQIGEGSADRSYGIQVARLAGVPEPVVARARAVLASLERGASRTVADSPARPVPDAASNDASISSSSSSEQLDLFGRPEGAFVRALADLELDRMSPLQALGLLHRWREDLAGGHPPSRLPD